MKASRVVFVVAVVLIAAYVVLVVMNMAGLAFPVEGVSMYPLLKTGYLAFVEPANVSNIRIGQIVVYYNPFYREYVIHRVVERVTGGVIVKGYNNLTNPYPDLNFTSGLPLVVTQSLLKGVVVLYVPYLGYALLSPYNYLLIVVLVIIAIISEELDEQARASS